MKYSLCYYFQPINNSTNQELFEKNLCNYYKNTDNFFYKGSNHVLQVYQQIDTFILNGIQRRTPVSPWRMHCTYCSLPKAPLKLSRYQVVLVWRYQLVWVTQWVSQSLENSFLKLHGNAFLVILSYHCLAGFGDIVLWVTPTPLWSLPWITSMIHSTTFVSCYAGLMESNSQ